MKRSIFALWLPLIAVSAVLLSCPLDGNSSNEKSSGGGDTPDLYKDFHNYPGGRADANGLLTIRNQISSKVLLFTESVSGSNYIGTVEGTSSVKVKLPEERFYTIVAVDKENYEEKKEKAYQFSDLTYYSNQQPYSMNVSPSSLFGAGTWILRNSSNYWVALQKPDKSGDNWAVLAPGTLRTTIPIQIGVRIDYVPHYYKELKYDGKIIALVEYDSKEQADTVITSEKNPTFNTSIGAPKEAASANLKPAILLTNNSDKTVSVYMGRNNQLSPSGTPGDDYAMASGWTAMITSGIEAGVYTDSIEFESLAWDARKSVQQKIEMKNGNVYRIVLNGDYTTTVTEETAEQFFEDDDAAGKDEAAKESSKDDDADGKDEAAEESSEDSSIEE